MTAEQTRLAEAKTDNAPWKKWGPYVSDRQWGTVREDYSENGDAWNYFTHEQARLRAYRWGEDGLAGICDYGQRICFALALWNGKDAILKERLFGVTNTEGNHGEDVKEVYFYLDNTPTHSYMKYLYKYPQQAFPYEQLVQQSKSRNRGDTEFEILDTGIFDDDKYFDVFVEYAKAGPEDLLVQITVENRSADAAPLHLLPTLWFRNTWTNSKATTRPKLARGTVMAGMEAITADHAELGRYVLACEKANGVLFTENETNAQKLWNKPNATPFVKDGINNYVVNGDKKAINPKSEGTKAAAHYSLTIAGRGKATIRLRLTREAPTEKHFATFAEVLTKRQEEADHYYAEIIPKKFDEDERQVMRQALAGLLWTKQFFYYDVDRWLREHNVDVFQNVPDPAPRNAEWHHMENADIISMPDKWEYPWYAAWDLAFHTLGLQLVDIDFAKHQLELMLTPRYLHPSGQIPAYEWNFSDVNPPVHAWATMFIYEAERAATGKEDVQFLERSFNSLLLNFAWWVNRKDVQGRNAFQGGFLGMDNIGVFDRSASLPTGGHLEQADGTGWMAFFAQSMLQIALELALHDRAYEQMVFKFFQHFVWIAAAMDRVGEHQDEMWDQQDGFFYDVLRLPGNQATRLKVRSFVGLLPLCATTPLKPSALEKLPELRRGIIDYMAKRPELAKNIHDVGKKGHEDRLLLAVVDQEKLRRIMTRVLDENEFLSPHGIRSLSRYHAENPYVFKVGEDEYRVQYLAGESDNGMFGGNSNWRGPVWFPTNVLIIRALLNFYSYYGDSFQIECPTGSGRMMNLFQVAQEIAGRLSKLFLRDESGERPIYGNDETGRLSRLQKDPHWNNYILFYEYFNGDTGRGLGASHQTGWTGLIAKIMQIFATISPEDMVNHVGNQENSK